MDLNLAEKLWGLGHLTSARSHSRTQVHTLSANRDLSHECGVLVRNRGEELPKA